jgi:hydroxyacyl-ACP dehydratase HTD2-like protein with hotdog domain
MTASTTPDFTTITVGDELPEQRHAPTHLQLFRYSAVTWNGHRIHYDTAYAKTEGYPDVLVQSHLHGAFLTRLCTDWAGPGGRLARLSLRVRRFAVPGDVLVCRARVTGTEIADGEGLVHLEIEEVRESDGTVCAPGTATVALPLT